VRILKRIINGGAGSMNRILTGANLNSQQGSKLLHEMAEDKLVTITPMGRMNRVTVGATGRQYLREVERFQNIIETLKKEYCE